MVDWALGVDELQAADSNEAIARRPKAIALLIPHILLLHCSRPLGRYFIAAFCRDVGPSQNVSALGYIATSTTTRYSAIWCVRLGGCGSPWPSPEGLDRLTSWFQGVADLAEAPVGGS